MLPEQLGYIAILTSTLGAFFYIRGIFFGTTKPNFISYFFWMLAPLIGVFFQLKAGAGLSVLPTFMAGFMPLLVLIAAFIKKNGYWQITVFDIGCGLFSFFAIILWIITRNTALAILFVVLADTLAAIPTLIKSWKFPESETALGYAPGILNGTIGLFIVNQWIFSLYAFNAYLIIMNALLLSFILRKKIFKS